MSEWNNAIAQYLAFEEECREGGNVFARLNAIRCEFAIRNGHDIYTAQRNEGGRKNITINWERLQAEGLRRPVSAPAAPEQRKLGALIAHTAMKCPEKEKKACAATILVVEDESLIRMMIANHLRDAGLKVIEARHADEALGILNSPAKIDLLITDIHMPGSLDGLALAKYVKQRETIPVIVVSGEFRTTPSQEIANAFYPKPYDLNTVLNRVKELLRGRNAMMAGSQFQAWPTSPASHLRSDLF